MTAPKTDLIRQRLRNQKLAGSALREPSEVVAWLTAVQAQDYAGAKWALSRRANGFTDAAVEQAFGEGAILRTHVLRPTWHFVTPADIRWMLALTAPRVKAAMAYYDRKLELDGRVMGRSRSALVRALKGGNQLTRAELGSVLQKAGITATGQRLGHLMMNAELDAVICSGARRGKQFTYALLDERAPNARILARDAALAELTKRYFSSHGPATLRDYAWWSGLTVREARAGIEMAGSLVKEVVDGLTYWFIPSKSTARRAPAPVYLLPNYDEYFIAYKDRGGAVEGARPARVAAFDEFSHLLVIDGKFAGGWKRLTTGTPLTIEARPFRPLERDEARALAAEVDRYGTFVNMRVRLSVV